MPPKKTSKLDKTKKADQEEQKQEQEVSQANNLKVEANKKLKTTQPSSNQPHIDKEVKKGIHNGHYTGEFGDGIFQKNIIRISSWNVNGIRASQKDNQFQNYLKESPDILCLNETKIDQENFDKLKIQNDIPKEYFQFWNFCKPPQKGYAGTAILTKVAPISVIYDIGTQKHDTEGRTITLEFDQFYLVACYVPNAGEGLKRLDYRTKEWDIDFQKFLNNLKSQKTTILCGDLNVAHQEIDLKNYKTNSKTAGFTPEERKGFTNYLSQGWTDTFRKLYPKESKYSFWSYRSGGRKTNTGWRLDYFVINNDSFKGVGDSIIRNDILGSDHCPIELTLNFDNL